MRQMKKDGRLSSERIAVLTETGIVWEPHSVAWEAGFARFLMLPPDANGSRYVPISFVTDDGFALGKWQENQRQTYQSGKLAEARRARLANAGIVWEVGSKKGRGPAAPAGDRDLCSDHSRRRLTLHRTLSSRATDAEAEWHEEWRQRLGCWWLALSSWFRQLHWRLLAAPSAAVRHVAWTLTATHRKHANIRRARL
jgi:hypothetical protein